MDKTNSSWLKTFSIGFSIISFGITIAIIGYIVLTTRQNQPANQPSPTPLPSETLVKEGDETTNWKRYTNSEDRFSIKYPPFLQFESSTYDAKIGGGKIKNYEWLAPEKKYAIFVISYNEGVNTGLEFNTPPKPDETIVLLNQDVKQLTAMDESLIHIGPVKNGDRNYMLIYSSGVNNKPDSTIFYQILSTFRFIE